MIQIASKITMKPISYKDAEAILYQSGIRAKLTTSLPWVVLHAAGIYELIYSPLTADQNQGPMTFDVPLQKLVYPPVDKTPEEIVIRDRDAFLASRAIIVQAIKVTTAAGNTFDGCEVSRGRMGDAVTGLDDVQTIRWVLADGSNKLIGRAELKEALYLIGREEEAVWIEAT